MIQGTRVRVFPEGMPEVATHGVVVLRANHRALVVAFNTPPSFAHLYEYTPRPTEEYVMLLYQPASTEKEVWSSLPPVEGTFVIEPIPVRIDK